MRTPPLRHSSTHTGTLCAVPLAAFSPSAVAVSFEEFSAWWDANKDKKSGIGSVVAKGAKLKGVAPSQSHHRWSRRWFVIEGFELVYYKVCRSCPAPDGTEQCCYSGTCDTAECLPNRSLPNLLRYACEQDAESAVRRQKERGRVALASFTVLPMIPEEDQADKSGGKGGKAGGKAHSQFSFMLTDGEKNFKVAALTEAERYSWVTQLMQVTDQIWSAGATAGLPGQLSCLGTTDVQLAEWKEASRDFTRAFVATGNGSGDMLLMGTRQLTSGRGGRAGMEAMVCKTKSGGNVNEEVTSLAAAEFEEIVRAAATESEIPLAAQALTDLSRRIIGHLTVTPGMDVLVGNEVAPAMFQNKFVVLSGCGQVRVATYGFIGGPAVGDRPDRKATPFVLRMLSSNLLEGFGTDSVDYAVRRSAALLMDEVMEEDVQRMAAAVSSGDYSGFFDLGGSSGGGGGGSAASSPSASPGQPQRQPSPLTLGASVASGGQPAQAGRAASGGGDAVFADVASMMEQYGAQDEGKDFAEHDQDDSDEDGDGGGGADGALGWQRMDYAEDDDDDDFDSDFEDAQSSEYPTAPWLQGSPAASAVDASASGSVSFNFSPVAAVSSAGGGYDYYGGGGGDGVDEDEDLTEDV